MKDSIYPFHDNLSNPRLTQFSSGEQVEYVYTPSGQKVREIHRLPKNIVVGGTLPTPHEMDSDITDFLSNNRAVVRASDGAFVQVTHYYPWGSVYGDMGTGASVQPYKYGDKELDLTAGVAAALIDNGYNVAKILHLSADEGDEFTTPSQPFTIQIAYDKDWVTRNKIIDGTDLSGIVCKGKLGYFQVHGTTKSSIVFKIASDLENIVIKNYIGIVGNKYKSWRCHLPTKKRHRIL